jgi:hypothetical protein
MDVVVSSSLFACARPFVWNSIDVGGRMAVVKLANGDVWVHSPVELDTRSGAWRTSFRQTTSI